MKRLVPMALAAVLAGACSGGSETTTSFGRISTATSAATTSTTTAPTTTTGRETAPTTTAAITEFVVTVGGTSVVRTYEVSRGDEIRLVFTADVTDEVHLHGYDLRADVAPGTDGVIEFIADIPGIFEIELEDAGTLVGELQVNP